MSRKTKKARKSFIPQSPPLYAAFATPVYSEESAKAGVVIGWERESLAGDDHWVFTSPVIVPFGGEYPLAGDEFGCSDSTVEVYPTVEEAKAAVPKLTEAVFGTVRVHETAGA